MDDSTIGPLPPSQPPSPQGLPIELTNSIEELAEQMQTQAQHLAEHLHKVLHDPSLSKTPSFLNEVAANGNQLNQTVEQCNLIR
jgi:hypothetical protein